MNISPLILTQFFGSILLQVIGLSLLPMTQGYTKPLPTTAVIILFAVAIGLLAKVGASGIPLSTVIPYAAASVPLGVAAVGFLYYHEPVSLLKIGLLIFACVLIGIANSK